MSLQSPEQLLLQSIVFELVFPMVEISELYHLPHKIMHGDKNSRQKAKIWFFLNFMGPLCNRYAW